MNAGQILQALEREADAHDYFAANGDLRMTTGDHANRAKKIRAAIAALSAEGGANYLPVHRVILADIEEVGTRCLDSGKCHHGCTKVCSRKTSCAPLTIAGSYLNDDWTLKTDQCKRCGGDGKRWNNAAEAVTDCGSCRPAAAATGDMVLVPREPTPEVLEACYTAARKTAGPFGFNPRAMWDAMISAAQQEPQ